MGYGLVNRVVPVEAFFDEALALARTVAQKAPVAVVLAKESVSRALDMDLDTALAFERKLFYLLFATSDQKEGMAAFREKRKAQFKGA